jgi:hypothetical protein
MNKYTALSSKSMEGGHTALSAMQYPETWVGASGQGLHGIHSGQDIRDCICS